MKIENLYNKDGIEVEGLKLITKDVLIDERGFFLESWNKYEYQKFLGPSLECIQLNQSRSNKDVLRGLHYQLEPKSQGKLVSCLRGKIFDVAVDIRQNSKTYSSWVGVELKDQLHQSLWIPPGFAHGFLTLSQFADVQYLVTNKWEKNLERCIVWNDQRIGIQWPLLKELPLLSEKDLEGLSLTEAESSQSIF